MQGHPAQQADLRPFQPPYNDIQPLRHGSPSDFEGSEAPTHESVVFTPGSEPEPFPFLDYLHDDALNDGPAHSAPTFGNHNNTASMQHPQHTSPPPNLNDTNNWSSHRDSTSGPSHSHTQLLEGRSKDAQPPSQSHNQYNPQHYPSQMQTNSMQHSAYTPNNLSGPPSGAVSMYAPFSNAFQDPESARQYRIQATRFERIPHRPPNGDPTIQELIATRPEQIRRIYNAMTRADAAKDNPGSIAMRRWAQDAFYPAHMVEAYAHKVFDCLLMQVQLGYRGWHHNDYASDDRKGEPEDKSVSCAERLDNIIRGLEEEKTICEDVMGSACQIRMFVNAPRAYARRKEANRHGNSKRGKATPTKPESARAKSRRLSARARQRQPTPCAPPTPNPNPGHALRDIEPNFQNHGPQPPYYSSALSPLSRQVPTMAQPEARPSSSYASVGYHSSPLSSPQPRANTQYASMSLPNHMPSIQSYMSPPPPGSHTSLPNSHGSLPNTPVTQPEVKYGNDTAAACGSSWQPTDNHNHLGDNSHAIFPQDNFDFDSWSVGGTSQQQTGSFLGHGEQQVQHGLPNNGSVNPSELNIDPSFFNWNGSFDTAQQFQPEEIGPGEKAQ